MGEFKHRKGWGARTSWYAVWVPLSSCAGFESAFFKQSQLKWYSYRSGPGVPNQRLPPIIKVIIWPVKKLSLLRRWLNNVPSEVTLLAYRTVVLFALEYVYTVWEPHQKGRIAKLERIKSLSAGILYRRYRGRDSVSARLNLAGLQPLHVRRKMNRGIFCRDFYCHKVDSKPSGIQNSPKPRSQQSTHNLSHFFLRELIHIGILFFYLWNQWLE